jgi:hypothetical protein
MAAKAMVNDDRESPEQGHQAIRAEEKRPAASKQGSQPPANLGFPKAAIDWDFKSDQTENAMAVEFIDGNQAKLRYVPSWKKWLAWDGNDGRSTSIKANDSLGAEASPQLLGSSTAFSLRSNRRSGPTSVAGPIARPRSRTSYRSPGAMPGRQLITSC